MRIVALHPGCALVLALVHALGTPLAAADVPPAIGAVPASAAAASHPALAAAPIDEQILAAPIAITKATTSLDELLQLELWALPPQLHFQYCCCEPALATPESFAGLSVRQALDRVCTELHAHWTLRYRRLVVVPNPDAVVVPQVPGPQPPIGDLAAIRTRILTWAAGGDGAEKALFEAYHSFSNAYDADSEIPALVDDTEVTAAVCTALRRDLDHHAPLTVNEVLLAGDLHLVAFAHRLTDRLRMLTMRRVYDSDSPDRIGQGLQRALIQTLGWIGDDGDDAVISVLEPIARYQIDPKTYSAASPGNLFDASMIFTGMARSSFPEMARDGALRALGRIGTRNACIALRHVLADDAPYAPRGAAAFALASTGDLASLPAIRAAWEKKRSGQRHEQWYQDDDSEAFGLLWSQTRLEGPDGVPGLLSMLDDPQFGAAALAAAVLVMDPRVVPAVTAALHRNPALSGVAVHRRLACLIQLHDHTQALAVALQRLETPSP